MKTVLPSVLTVDQAAELLQSDSEVLVREMESGKLRAFQVGGDWRIAETALLEFMGETIPERARAKEGAMTAQVRNSVTDPGLSRLLAAGTDWRSVGEFTYEWPTHKGKPRDVEEFPEAHRGRVQLDERAATLLIGFTDRRSAGMENRRRAVVFLEGAGGSIVPAVEFAGANDFQHTGVMASVIKLPRTAGAGHRHLRPGMAVPPEYTVEGLKLAVYSDLVQGPHAARSMAVVATKDQLDVMAYHGVVRAGWKGWL